MVAMVFQAVWHLRWFALKFGFHKIHRIKHAVAMFDAVAMIDTVYFVFCGQCGSSARSGKNDGGTCDLWRYFQHHGETHHLNVCLCRPPAATRSSGRNNTVASIKQTLRLLP